MPIIGMVVKEISAQNDMRPLKKDEKINIQSKPKIESVEKTTVNVGEKKDVLLVTFGFNVNYEPNLGHIKFKGEIIYDTENVNDVISKWGSDKILENDIMLDILNTVFRKCLSDAISISDQLRLPPPLKFPTVKLKDSKDYIG